MIPDEDYSPPGSPDPRRKVDDARYKQTVSPSVFQQLQDKFADETKVVIVNEQDPTQELEVVAVTITPVSISQSPEPEPIVEQPRVLRPINLVTTDQSALDKLTDDLGQLLDSELDTDVTLVLADGKTFPVHQLILKSRCKALLKDAQLVKPIQPPPPPPLPTSSSCCGGSNSKNIQRAPPPAQRLEPESRIVSYVVELPEAFTGELVQGMLRYIYTSRIECLRGIMEELLVAAGDYGLLELKDKLERQLCEDLDDDNCVRLLLFADKQRASWNCRQLKRRAMYHIKERILLLIEKDDFKKLKSVNCRLLDEILRALVLGDEWIERTT